MHNKPFFKLNSTKILALPLLLLVFGFIHPYSWRHSHVAITARRFFLANNVLYKKFNFNLGWAKCNYVLIRMTLNSYEVTSPDLAGWHDKLLRISYMSVFGSDELS